MNIPSVRNVLLALELGSLSAAATRLGVPVSTISRRIKELEKDLGRRLVVRSGRGISVAEDAQETLIKLRAVLQAVDDCYAPAASVAKLRVTAPLEMTISLLPKLIPGFHKEFPGIVVELIGDDRLLGLVESDFDLAIRTGPLNDSSLIAKKLHEGRFVLVAAPSLAEQICKINDLATTPFLEISGPPPSLTGHWQNEPFMVNPPILARLNSFTGALPSLLAGLAFAQIPAHVVKEHLDQGLLVEIQPVKLTQKQAHALYPNRHRNNAAVKALIAHIELALKV